MYNHGLATFVLGQAHGMTNDKRISGVLEQALRLIANTQSRDGGWDYRARRQNYGHDLSLVVMQAKALRSAVDSGLEVRNDVIQLSIQSVRQKYKAKNGARSLDDPKIKEGPGQFTYDGHNGTTAMAAAGVVCLQEFGQYDDWRIPKNLDVLSDAVKGLKAPRQGDGRIPFDAYTLYYVGQALYQVGGTSWKDNYPTLRDQLITAQVRKPSDPGEDGSWRDPRLCHWRQAFPFVRNVRRLLYSGNTQSLPADPSGRQDRKASANGSDKITTRNRMQATSQRHLGRPFKLMSHDLAAFNLVCDSVNRQRRSPGHHRQPDPRVEDS